MTGLNRLIFYDLETTGFDPKTDEIIEIGAKDLIREIPKTH